MKHQLMLKLKPISNLENIVITHDGGKLTVDVVGVDVLDGSAADISRLSSQSDPPQLVHPTQLDTQTHKRVCELPACLLRLN